ncbi:MAG: RsmB/NOP family class I SAM-dependent RNA methyltransferase [Pseudomonadota bacterium]
MRLGGRLAAAIDVLETLETQRRPLAQVLKDWGHAHRFAGSGDRAAIGNLVHDALRYRRSLAARMGDDSARAAVLATASLLPGYLEDGLPDFEDDRFAPDPLTEAEQAALSGARSASIGGAAAADCPDWLWPSFGRVFGDRAADEIAALAARAPVDLRLNPLRSAAPRVEKALARFKPKKDPAFPLLRRVPVGEGFARTAHLTSEAVYQKGWIEVQDAGSQTVTELALAGIKPRTVLDLCAGAGGKTLALSVFMGGKGQVFAHDIDRRRMADLWPRVKRSGAHNIQVIEPDALPHHEHADTGFDLVLVDAPCTGTGTWRRHPDTKWRVRETALQNRIGEQAQVLETAAKLIKPGGRLAYVTCSLLAEENEDQLLRLLAAHPDLKPVSASTLFGALERDVIPGYLPALAFEDYEAGVLGARLTPLSSSTDGFFIGCLQRAKHP